MKSFWQIKAKNWIFLFIGDICKDHKNLNLFGKSKLKIGFLWRLNQHLWNWEERFILPVWPLIDLSSGIEPFLLWLIVWDPSMETQQRTTPNDLGLLSERALGEAIERPRSDLAPAAIIITVLWEWNWNWNWIWIKTEEGKKKKSSFVVSECFN